MSNDLRGLVRVLEQASSGGPHQKDAENQLKQFEESRFHEYLAGLCQILTDSSGRGELRQFAGICLKNLVGGSGHTSQVNFERLRQRWTIAPPNVRSEIKNATFRVLSTNNREARKTGAQVLAQIAKVETIKEWQNLIPNLLRMLQEAIKQGNRDVVESVFLCIGFVSEECNSDDVQKYATDILKGIASGMSINDTMVRLVSIKCLNAILPMIKPNMQVPQQQKLVVQMMCACAGAKGATDLQLHGFMALARTVDLYYENLEPYMETLFQTTKKAISRGVNGDLDQEVTKQAIEFWSSTAEVELDLLWEAQEAKSRKKVMDPYKQYCNKALGQIVPLYLQALSQHSDDVPDEEEWDVRKAAGCSLELFAQVTASRILDEVLSFVQKNITSSNWHFREAALCSFGMILDGPAKQDLIPRANKILPLVLKLMDDRSSPYVMQTGAWCFGRICHLVPEATINGPNYMNALQNSIEKPNGIAHYGCWAIASLANFYKVQGMNNAPLQQPRIAYQVINALLTRAGRDDANPRVITACFEAVNNIIQFGPQENDMFVDMIRNLVPELVKRVAEITNSSPAEQRNNTTQNKLGSLLSSLNVCMNFLGTKSLNQDQCNTLMGSLIRMSISDSAVIEEALLCISYICYVIGGNFLVYFKSKEVQHMLMSAIDLEGHKNKDLCGVGVGVAGDCLLACADQIRQEPPGELQEFTDVLVRKLINLMLHKDYELTRKSHLVSALADVAIAFGPFWERYTEAAVKNTFVVGKTKLAHDAFSEDVKAMNEIRLAVLDVCRSTLLAMAEKGAHEAFGKLTGDLIEFFVVITEDPHRSEDLVKNALEFLIETREDLQDHSGLLRKFQCPPMQRFLNMAGCNTRLKDLAGRAFQALS